MSLKLSRVGVVRDAALSRVDLHYSRRINQLLGPLATLHSLKRTQALGGGGSLVDVDEAEAVLEQAERQDAELARIEKERLELKRRIREAKTAAEINELIRDIPEEPTRFG